MSEVRDVGITTVTVDILSSQRQDAIGLLGMYVFLCRTAKKQRTTKIWANRRWLMGTLGIGRNRYDRLKKKLSELGLIEIVPQEIGKRDGRYYKTYWKVNYALNR